MTATELGMILPGLPNLVGHGSSDPEGVDGTDHPRERGKAGQQFFASSSSTGTSPSTVVEGTDGETVVVDAAGAPGTVVVVTASPPLDRGAFAAGGCGAWPASTGLSRTALRSAPGVSRRRAPGSEASCTKVV